MSIATLKTVSAYPNSPRTHYALSAAFFPVVQNYGTKTGERLLKKFIGEQGALVEVYQQRRSGNMIALRDAAGHEYRLSPGKHNQLQVAVMEQFAPRFAPGAKLLYLGDTANKSLVMDLEELARLGFPVDKHSKLPDVVLYLPKKRWLYLIEVVTSHGPVSPKRFQELEKSLIKVRLGGSTSAHFQISRNISVTRATSRGKLKCGWQKRQIT